MSDTPETDALLERFRTIGEWPDLFVHARRLERERDEARDALTDIHRWIERNHSDGVIDSLSYYQNLERVTDRWYDRLDQAERDRDITKEELHRLTGKLGDMLEANMAIGRERDELRKELLKCNEYNDELYRKLKTK